MNNTIKSVLEEIEKNGFEAYVVGGYVRDYIINKPSFDVDICTNALPKDIGNIFKQKVNNEASYGSIRIKIKKYTFDITTYRIEHKYIGRKPAEIEYTNNLLKDIERRDFTINSLCMNSKGVIIDLLDGNKDINNKVIRIIGNIDKKLKEDPLRILRAIRFATVLDFNIEDELLNYIKNNPNLVETLSYTRKKEELNYILQSNMFSKGLDLIHQLGLDKYLGISYDNIIFTPDLLGMWAQIKYDERYPFTKNESQSINSILNIIKYGKIDNIVLYNYGLYLSTISGYLLDVDTVIINKIYNNLPIYSTSDIDIDVNDIMVTCNVGPSKELKEIINDLKNKILNNELKNKKEDIIDYLKR